MTRKSHQRTVGTLISTVCYFVLAAFSPCRQKTILTQDMACAAGGWGFVLWPVLRVVCGLSFMIWWKSLEVRREKSVKIPYQLSWLPAFFHHL